MTKYDNENNFTDDEFSCMSPITKEQFRNLFLYCDPVFEWQNFRYVTKKNLLTFLCKMRQGLSDDFLTFMFGYNTRQRTSVVIDTVRKSLMLRFVPENLGFNAITRDEFIQRHVTDFANQLYNPEPTVPRVIAYIDGTYLEVDKSSNFQTARQSYCTHKHHYLLKPATIVAPNGYFLDVHGPYFSDTQNNDAAMLQNEFQRDVNTMKGWFQENDILILDRGYRDVTPLLHELGIFVKIPPFLERNQRQFTTEEANESRLITKTRWIIESRNGHIKTIFKFLGNKISVTHAVHVGDFYRIAAAIINRYRPTIDMRDANAELANELLQKAQEPNVMQARVEVDNLRTRNARWDLLDHFDEAGFPNLTLEYLRDITVGVYQIHLAPGYIQDKIQRDQDEVFEFDQLINEPGLIRVRIYSRFATRERY